MDVEQLRVEFRKAVADAGERGRTTAYPLELRAIAVAYVEARTAQGVNGMAACRELGIGRDTFLRWRRSLATPPRPEDLPSFRPVEIAAPTAPAAAATLVVHGPLGLRIEGLDVAALAALLRALA
jgi:transposase